ncbi:MAG TPA: MFS transporter [Dehalococcoidia bacterium]|nr:MFS transporter [Dehalococcoidia bacterium]
MSADPSAHELNDRPASGWRATFVSLSVPEYALYFWGMLAFFSGMNMMIVLRGYLVYDLTGSSNALAAVMLSVSLPMLVVAPIGGVITDRVDRRSLMLAAQLAVALVNLVNTILILTGAVALWNLLIMSALSGVAFSFNMPARQAAMPNLVPRHMLMNAISLGSSAMNGTRIIAPAVGGLLIAPIGIGGGFAVLTGLYVLSAVLTLGLPKMPPKDRDATVTFFSDFKGGFSFIRSDRLVFGLLLLGTIPLIFAMPYQTMLPVFAKDVWHVGPTGLGTLQAMAGVGGLIGTLITANMDSSPRKGWIMLAAACMTGVFLVAFSFSIFGIALVMIACVGLSSMVFMTVNNTMITTLIPDSVRGRVSSVLMMTFGLMPLGVVPAGILAEIIGVEAVTAIGAGLLILTVLVTYAAFPQFRTLDAAVRKQRAVREAAWDAEAAVAGG